jgi:hypothetical protein
MNLVRLVSFLKVYCLSPLPMQCGHFQDKNRANPRVTVLIGPKKANV